MRTFFVWLALAGYFCLVAFAPAQAVDAGSSASYSVNTGSGFVAPTAPETRFVGATPTAPLGGTAANMNDDSTGTTVTTSNLGDLSAASDNSRVIGRLDLGANYTITKIEVKQYYRPAGGTGTAGLYYSTDGSTWTLLGSGFSTPASPTNFSSTGSVTARYVSIIPPATNFGANPLVFSDLNAYTSPSDNMTLVTTAQTADVTIESVRVLLEYDPIDAITLNTDLTVEVTCDGGSNWASATLEAAGTGQAGRLVAETVEASCGANTGTSFASRIKTFNNKAIHIYGTAITVR